MLASVMVPRGSGPGPPSIDSFRHFPSLCFLTGLPRNGLGLVAPSAALPASASLCVPHSVCLGGWIVACFSEVQLTSALSLSISSLHRGSHSIWTDLRTPADCSLSPGLTQQDPTSDFLATPTSGFWSQFVLLFQPGIRLRELLQCLPCPLSYVIKRLASPRMGINAGPSQPLLCDFFSGVFFRVFTLLAPYQRLSQLLHLPRLLHLSLLLLLLHCLDFQQLVRVMGQTLGKEDAVPTCLWVLVFLEVSGRWGFIHVFC